MKARFLALAATLLTSLSAQAAVEANLVYKTPTGTALSTDTIELWVTLSLSATSDALFYDASLPIAEQFGSTPLPLVGNNYNADLYDVPFAAYDYTSRYVSRNCSGTFTTVCDNGPYTIEQGSSSWFTTAEPFQMVAGESRDFLLATLTPTNGSVAAGTYIFYTGAVGFTVHGSAEDGTLLEAPIEFTACQSGDASCAFTRTVTSVPEPSEVALAIGGLLSVMGLQRLRQRGRRQA